MLDTRRRATGGRAHARAPAMKVTLVESEIMIAAYVGSARNTYAVLHKWRSRAGMSLEQNWTAHIEGAAGELAVAKALGLYWRPNVGVLDADDVGPYQVRTNISRRYTDLCL